MDPENGGGGWVAVGDSFRSSLHAEIGIDSDLTAAILDFQFPVISDSIL